ncbi:spermatogenesis-associated protein 33 isoform X2 [Lacerta agilis]|uniref:spermatogenesis-associated protein 33 isoform X2 n=1 Tax=Lacerta agilis TaxID=80427 RepID=UPI0014192E83|nr:spermatogenesis-associated protein 33 isoform X2 [Lacerta agilis]
MKMWEEVKCSCSSLQNDVQEGFRLVPAHVHKNIDGSKAKEPKPAFQEQSQHMYGNIQPSTSGKATKKPVPHPMQVEVSTDKLAKKKRLIPKIIVTGPSEEVLLNSYTDEIPETKTIRDTEDFGAYSVHTKPSTVDAYRTSRDQ